MPEPQEPRSVRTRTGAAGQPQTNANRPAANPRPPTDAELDERDRQKTGPRRQAGPPLEGDHPEPLPMQALAGAQTPDATDPVEQ